MLLINLISTFSIIKIVQSQVHFPRDVTRMPLKAPRNRTDDDYQLFFQIGEQIRENGGTGLTTITILRNKV